jgi:hypothetical protein
MEAAGCGGFPPENMEDDLSEGGWPRAQLCERNTAVEERLQQPCESFDL